MKLITIQRKYSFLGFLVLLFVLFSACSKKETVVPEPEPETEERELPDVIKILSYNILEGMKTDRPNNYDNFVAWINELGPDIIAFQEANGLKQSILEELAARWGHRYVITNPKANDNYPVAITSKYPIESRRRVTLHVSHGAIFAKLLGADLNIVNTHFWPQSYWHQQGDNLGNEYRLHEANLVLDSTIRKFPEEPNWIFVGDLNSRSRHDFLPGQSNFNFDVTDQIEEDGFKDAIHHLHGKRSEGAVYEFEYPGSRIDFIFATPTVLNNVVKAYSIYDDFTNKYSDHPPFYMEIKIK